MKYLFAILILIVAAVIYVMAYYFIITALPIEIKQNTVIVFLLGSISAFGYYQFHPWVVKKIESLLSI